LIILHENHVGGQLGCDVVQGISCVSFLMLQNSCQSSGFLELFAFLYNNFFFFQFFFKSIEPGKVVAGSCKMEWYMLVHNVDGFC